MSYIVVNAIHQDGTVHQICELPNNHRGAPVFWDAIAKRYGIIGPDQHLMVASMFPKPNEPDPFERLWALVRNPVVDVDWRLVLAATADCQLIRRAELVRFAIAFDRFHCEVRSPKGSSVSDPPGNSGHAEEIGRILEVIDNVASRELLGVCFDWCSATENMYWIETNEDGDGRPLNVLTDLDQEGGHKGFWLDAGDIVKPEPAQ